MITQIDNNTIIDSAHVRGHNTVFDEVTFGQTCLTGMFEQGTRVACGSFGPQTEPWRSYIGFQAKRQTESIDSSKDTTMVDVDIENLIIREEGDVFETNPQIENMSSNMNIGDENYHTEQKTYTLKIQS